MKREWYLHGVLVLLILIISGVDAGASVTWQKKFDGGNDDGCSRVIQTADGGYIAMGSTYSFGSGSQEDIWLLKLDILGTPEWQRVYGQTGGRTSANDLQQVSDHGYVLAGPGGFVMKVDSAGDIEWQKSLVFPGRGNNAVAVRETLDHGFLVLAQAAIPGFTNDYSYEDFWVIKLDSNGNIQWQKLLDYRQHDTPGAMLVTSDGGYFIAGFTRSNKSKNDILVIKLNSLGEIEWQNLYGGALSSYLSAVLEADSGGFIVAGTTPVPNYWGYAWVMKLGAGGELLWQRKYNGLSGVNRFTMTKAAQGAYMLAVTETGPHNSLLKINQAGNPVWLSDYFGNAYPQAIQATQDGYVLPSTVDSYYRGKANFVIHKMDSDGNSCNLQLNFKSTTVIENDFIAQPSQVNVSIPPGSLANLDYTVRDTNVIPETYCVSAMPEIFIDPDFDFGQVGLGESVIKSALLKNNGGADLDISAITVTGSEADQFIVNSNCDSVQSGDSCIIDVTFAPKAPGNKSAVLAIASSDPNRPQIEIPLAGAGIDTSPPLITLKGQELVTVEAGTSYFDAGTTAYDEVDGDLTASIITTNPVDTAKVGTYTITYEVVDHAGNQARANRTVQVVDTIPPSVSIATDRSLIWPPNHKSVAVLVDGAAEDSGSGIASIDIRVTDEYGVFDGPVAGFGKHILLEAWREGSDRDGRVYTLTVTAIDKAGNLATATSTVTVPHDQHQRK